MPILAKTNEYMIGLGCILVSTKKKNMEFLFVVAFRPIIIIISN